MAEPGRSTEHIRSQCQKKARTVTKDRNGPEGDVYHGVGNYDY